jgi:hypothetical protein
VTAAKGIFHSPPRGHLRRLKLDGCGRTELSGFSGRIINAPVGSSRMTWSIAQKNESAQYSPRPNHTEALREVAAVRRISL